MRMKKELKKRCKIRDVVTITTTTTSPSSSSPSTTTMMLHSNHNNTHKLSIIEENKGWNGNIIVKFVLGFMLVLLLVIIPQKRSSNSIINSIINSSSTSTTSSSEFNLNTGRPPRLSVTAATATATENEIIQLNCPIPIAHNENTKNGDGGVGIGIGGKNKEKEIGKYIRQGDKYGLKHMNANELWNWITNSIDVDDWHCSYQDQMERHVNFIRNEIVPYFMVPSNNSNGSSNDNSIHIYESAFGVGRNMAIILEVIQQEQQKVMKYEKQERKGEFNNFPNIIVYGNDYVVDSAIAATTIYSKLQPYQSKLGGGTICGGVDSTNLSYVPNDTFDIVLTGYIAPISDPLNFSTKYSEITKLQQKIMYMKVCKNGSSSVGDGSSTTTTTTTAGEKDMDGGEDNNNNNNLNSTIILKAEEEKVEDVMQNLLEQMIQIQENHFAKWVGEMIRITKPGHPIFIQEVPLRKCDEFHDNGGVNHNFWLNIKQNQLIHNSWKDIDINSIRFSSIPTSSKKIKKGRKGETRYNVSMMKKGEEKEEGRKGIEKE